MSSSVSGESSMGTTCFHMSAFWETACFRILWDILDELNPKINRSARQTSADAFRPKFWNVFVQARRTDLDLKQDETAVLKTQKFKAWTLEQVLRIHGKFPRKFFGQRRLDICHQFAVLTQWIQRTRYSYGKNFEAQSCQAAVWRA